METMKEVTRYECQFCKKDFKAPDRHHCKFNPELKNCFTCKHLKDWETSEEYHDYGVGYGREPNYPDCAVECGEWDIELIKDVQYDMQCSSWEEGRYDWSKEGDINVW